MKLSVIIIAKDAEEQIADAIESVREVADEVIVVDNGSTDRTAEIAKYLKARVVNVERKDFSQLRNMGLKEAKGKWILYLDTDERVSKELREEIARITSSQISLEQNLCGFRVRRKNFYFGSHEWPYIERLERLFRRTALRGWRGRLHESPIIEGSLGELDGFLLHYTHRDLSSMLAKTIEWSKIEAELRFKTDHPKMAWWRFLRVMISAFLDSYIRQGGWKVGTVGLIESIYQAFSMFITYARLWEMQNEKREMRGEE